MSIVETYKQEFSIFSYDEDLVRSEELNDSLKAKGYNFTSFNSRGIFLEAIKNQLPHIFILYYQPLNMKFHELLSKIREQSSEVEIVLLGSKEFWPGIQSLIKTGAVNDYWSWPTAGPEALALRINHIIEKTIFKYIAEQRSDATARIVKNLDDLKSHRVFEPQPTVEGLDVVGLLGQQFNTEPKLIEELVRHLKENNPESDFIYLKNYPARDQLLVMKTSFSSEGYFRGQAIPFSVERMTLDRNETLHSLRKVLEESFSCDKFIIQPVELAGDFYGFIMAVNFDSSTYLQKTARYLSVSVRNTRLENEGKKPDRDHQFENEVSSRQFPLSLSTEVSRARRLKMPLSLIVAHLEYPERNDRLTGEALGLIKNSIRNYDFICRLENNQIAIVLPHCSYEDAAIKAETIRRMLVAKGLKSQNTALRLCFGVSEFPNLSVDSDALIEDAKVACSQVVVSGKNKVCLYSQPEDFEPEFHCL